MFDRVDRKFRILDQDIINLANKLTAAMKVLGYEVVTINGKEIFHRIGTAVREYEYNDNMIPIEDIADPIKKEEISCVTGTGDEHEFGR